MREKYPNWYPGGYFEIETSGAHNDRVCHTDWTEGGVVIITIVGDELAIVSIFLEPPANENTSYVFERSELVASQVLFIGTSEVEVCSNECKWLGVPCLVAYLD